VTPAAVIRTGTRPSDIVGLGMFAGIEFESLRTYPYCVALTAAHPFARLKSIPLEKVVAEPLLALRCKDYHALSGHAAPRLLQPSFIG
jgi:DNA-binding transcriptional LysR family regulator